MGVRWHSMPERQGTSIYKESISLFQKHPSQEKPPCPSVVNYLLFAEQKPHILFLRQVHPEIFSNV